MVISSECSNWYLFLLVLSEFLFMEFISLTSATIKKTIIVLQQSVAKGIK